MATGFSKDIDTGTQVWKFAFESFKARALCVTSDRWSDGSVPAAAVPVDRRVYRLYGAATAKEAQSKHAAWSNIYQRGPDLSKHPVVSYKSKVSDEVLREIFPCGAFTRLLILTDIADQFGSGIIRFPKEFGPGVRIGKETLKAKSLERLRVLLNKSRPFRANLGQRAKVHHLGHLVCELRQSVFRGMDDAATEALLCQLSRGGPAARRARASQRRKAELCGRIAEFSALPKTD